jgi:hypothetical protein
MSRSDLELRLVRWLDDGPDGAPAGVVEAALREARAQPQVRAIELPWLPGLSQRHLTLPASRSVVQAALSFGAIAIAATLVVWSLNNLSIRPAMTPTPGITPSPVVTPSASPTATPGTSPSASSTATPSAPSTASAVPSTGVSPSASASAFAYGWTAPALIAPGEFDDLALTIDNDGSAHVAGAVAIGAGDSRGIWYMTNKSGGWIAEQVTRAPAGQDDEEYDGEPDIAVDVDGTVWIAFTRYDCGGCTPTISNAIYVTNNKGGSWSEIEEVAGSQAYGPSIAAENGIAHLAYAFGQMPEQPSYPSHYATNASGDWVATRIASGAAHPQLAIGPDGVPRVAYATPSGVTVGYFPGADATSFTDVPGPSGEVDALFYSVDALGRTHLVWMGPSLPMHHVFQDTDGTWSEPAAVANDRLRLDAVAGLADGSLISSARSLDEAVLGPYFTKGLSAEATRLASGETTMTDVAVHGAINFVYSYAGDQAVHGIWYTEDISAE